MTISDVEIFIMVMMLPFFGLLWGVFCNALIQRLLLVNA